MADAGELLARARARYDDPRRGLAASARRAGWGGFAGGAQWLRLALAYERGVEPMGRANWTLLGVGKYALATGAALLVAGLCLVAAPWLSPLAIVVFYLVEVRFVFAFPLALDGHDAPLAASHALLRRTMPWGPATARVLRIAAEMLLGGLAGRGVVRSWCVGCLAVLLWYEEARLPAGGTA